jgi:acetoin utilization protein AcuB
MFVRDWMTQKPLTITPDTAAETAIRMMREHRLRHLPVVKKSATLVGLVALPDLLHASPPSTESLEAWEISYVLARMRVRDVMTKRVIVVGEDCPLEAAALVMSERKIGCLPVVEGTRLIGIITETDIFRAFTDQLGARRTGLRLTLNVKDQKGELAKITGQISKLGGNIISMTTLPAKDKTHYVVMVKVVDAPQEALVEALSQVDMEVVDAREGRGWKKSDFKPYHWTLEG